MNLFHCTSLFVLDIKLLQKLLKIILILLIHFQNSKYTSISFENTFKNVEIDRPPSSNSSSYNMSNRAYPDVSLNAHNYQVYIDGTVGGFDGTSCSTPVFSAFVSLINAQRIKAGLSTVGWLNPAIWAAGQSIVEEDITSGNNFCTADPSACCAFGFTAAVGWGK